MDRLTELNENKTAYFYPQCFDKCGGIGYSRKCDSCDLLDRVCDKLGEYEKLEEQGKLLRLPFAVGDTVYTNHSMQGWYFRKENRPYKAKVAFIGINGEDNYMNVDFGNGRMLQFKFSDIEKTVFLTQEQAELALKEMEGENE